MGLKKKAAAALMLALGLTVTAAPNAFAHNAKIDIGCDSVDVEFRGFKNKPGNTASVNIDGAGHTVTWDGPNNDAKFGISPQNGHTVQVNISWNTNGHQGSESASWTADGCQPEPEPTEEPEPEPTEEPESEPTEEPEPEPTEEPTPQPEPEEECELDEDGEEECEEEDEEGEEEEEEEPKPAPTTPATTPPTTPPSSQTTAPPATQPVIQPVTQPVPVTLPVTVEQPKQEKKDEVKGISVSRTAVRGQVVPATLALTGSDLIPALVSLGTLFLLIGVALRLVGRRRVTHHSS